MIISIRIISVLFQPVQVLQKYFIVTYIQCPKSPNRGLECGELMVVVLLFVHNVFHARGMLCAANIPANSCFPSSQVVSPDRKAQLPVCMERITERTAGAESGVEDSLLYRALLSLDPEQSGVNSRPLT